MTTKIETDKNENLSELVYIIDRSGSMAGLENDTIGGFNASLVRQKELDGEAKVSVVLFDHECDVIADRIDLTEAKGLNEKTYTVRGCTALLDAVGGAIDHIQMVQRYMPDGHKAGHVIFTIITDGLENASKKYRAEQVKELIKGAEAQGWEFIFLGANMDAVAEAGKIGIDADRAVTYMADSVGTAVAYDAAADFTCACRCMPMEGERVSGGWAEKVKRDLKRRKK